MGWDGNIVICSLSETCSVGAGNYVGTQVFLKLCIFVKVVNIAHALWEQSMALLREPSRCLLKSGIKTRFIYLKIVYVIKDRGHIKNDLEFYADSYFQA